MCARTVWTTRAIPARSYWFWKSSTHEIVCSQTVRIRNQQQFKQHCTRCQSLTHNQCQPEHIDQQSQDPGQWTTPPSFFKVSCLCCALLSTVTGTKKNAGRPLLTMQRLPPGSQDSMTHSVWKRVEVQTGFPMRTRSTSRLEKNETTFPSKTCLQPARTHPTGLETPTTLRCEITCATLETTIVGAARRGRAGEEEDKGRERNMLEILSF